MLYSAAMPEMSCRLNASKSTTTEALPLGTSTKPLSFTPSLKICVHVQSTVSVPFGQKHATLFSREIVPFVQGSHRPAPGLAENVFSGQAVHREKIISGLLNLPAGHRWHCGAGAPADPVTCTATHNNTITFFLLLSMLY